MADGMTVDSNVISAYIPEYIREQGEVFETIETILGKIGIALTRTIEWEWKSTCPGLVLVEWLTDQIKKGRIVYVTEEKVPRNVMTTLIQKYGFPVKSRDRRYISCAYGTDTKYILSEDIDFFDPKAKCASEKMKRRVKTLRGGALCKYLKKELGITVGCLCHCKEDFPEHFG